MSEAGAVPEERVRVWDLPTRLFHWTLVLLIPALYGTATSDRIELHVTLGLVMLGLVLFRLFWGLIGSSTARFGNFLKGPRGVVSYLNGSAAHGVGHNPLGGWSVVLLLAVLSAQVGLGLFASDEDGLVAGPLAYLVDIETSETLTERHKTMFNVLLALIIVHLLAIVVYAAQLQNLVGPMLSGSADAPVGTAAMVGAKRWRLGLALVLATGVAGGLWTWV